MIAWTIYITFAGAFGLLFMPRFFARWIALATALAGFAIESAGVFPSARCRKLSPPLCGSRGSPRWEWNIHLAADGISLTLALVTGLTAVSAVLFSWDVEQRPNEFFFWLLLVIGGSYGVFLSADLFLLFVFYELVIVPKYFLIAIWGSTNKEYGAMKLTLYSFVGGALVFLGDRRRLCHRRHRSIFSSSRNTNFRRNFRRGRSRSCSSGSPSSRASGRCTPGRRPATSPRRPPVRCCSPGS